MISETLQQLLRQFLSSVDNIIGAILVLLLGLIVSRFVSGLIRKLLVRLRIDQFGEKLQEIDIISKSNMSIHLSTVFSKVIYYFLLIFFLVAAADILAMPAISNLATGLFNFIPKAIVGLIILIFGMLVAEGIRGLVETTLTSLGLPSAKMIAQVLFYFLFINVIILAIAQAEINTDFLEQNISIIIGGGVFAFSLGYGLASKDTMANYLANFYAHDKVDIGDMITIDGSKGRVIDMDRSSLTIESDTDKIIIPLKNIISNNIVIHK